MVWDKETRQPEKRKVDSSILSLTTSFGLVSSALTRTNADWASWCLQPSSDHDCPCVTMVGRPLSHADRTSCPGRRFSVSPGYCPVTARTVQGMARVRPGRLLPDPYLLVRSVRRGSRVKRDFACTFTQLFHLCSLSCGHGHA